MIIFLPRTLPAFALSILLLRIVFAKEVVNESAKFLTENIFASNKQFVNAEYREKLQRTLRAATPRDAAIIRKFLDVPTAIWLPDISSVTGKSSILLRSLGKAVADRERTKEARLVVMVVYNLPNRDCGAGSSANEVCCRRVGSRCDMSYQRGDCSGVSYYKREFIDKIAKAAKDYCSRTPMAFMLEPDALAFLVANSHVPTCGASTRTGYIEGISYAAKALQEACSSAAIYVDAGNPSWLGWRGHTQKFIDEIVKMGLSKVIRGFVINISGYDELGQPCPVVGMCSPKGSHRCCRKDACKLSESWNVGFNCMNFAKSLREEASKRESGFKPHVVIDTSRNGVSKPRVNCENWCNIRGAGVGNWPTGETWMRNVVDGFAWIKPPGESDGCTRILPGGRNCPRFGDACESVDSFGSRPDEPRAPEAGQWFEEHLKMMMRNGVHP